MATLDPDGPVAARWWRVVGSDLTTEMWDVEHLDIQVDGATVVRHVASGDAGSGYEADRAFTPDRSWWGGRADPAASGAALFHLGVEFDRPAVPTSITLLHADSPHVAGQVTVESSDDGERWTSHGETVLRPRRPGDEHAGDTVFYAPADAPAASRWRLVAPSTVHGFAWDVDRIRFLRRGVELEVALASSGDAGGEFGVENTTAGQSGCWGGRPGEDGRLHVTASAEDGDLIAIDRVILEQGTEHWTRSMIVEQEIEDGQWRTWRHLDGLRPGRNDLLLGPRPRRPNRATRASRKRANRAPEPSVRFGPFDDRRILVLVAAYRDPELADTVAHAFAQAAYPEHVRFAVCHQFDDVTHELLDRWSDDPRVRIDAVPHTESKGCCWARHRTFQMYDDEPYILQIDAHMRFAARWDVRYVEMLESIDAELPILSTYPPRYTLDDDGRVSYDLTSGVQRLYVDEVFPDLATRQKTSPVTDLTRPEPSPALAAGQLFTRGRFCRDVPYDPEIYFLGEEVSLAARAFTSGYDLFCPTENLVWHLYQHDHPKHWDDNPDHQEQHRGATDRLRILFQGDHRSLGEYGLGSVRTLAEFEDHAGIRLGARRVAADGRVTIRIDRSTIEPRDDYAVFVVVFLDAADREVARREVYAPDVLGLTRDTVSFESVPGDAKRFVVVPTTRSGSIGELTIRSIDGTGGAR